KGIEEFEKRLSRYCKLEIIQVRDEKAPENLSTRQKQAVKELEADRILKNIKEGSYVIALAIDGKSFTSEEFAKKLEMLAVGGHSNISFVIGGSLGLHDKVLKRADIQLSF